ncbi:MAG: hypothetical protein ChlgKO_02770 [Chlamydiales bacterium]
MDIEIIAKLISHNNKLPISIEVIVDPIPYFWDIAADSTRPGIPKETP